MKRGPQPGERTLTHISAETGDIQTFAIVEENFDPKVLRLIENMLPKLPGGWEAIICNTVSSGTRFLLSLNELLVSDNLVRNVTGNVELTTALLPKATLLSPREIASLADCAQSVAIVLATRGHLAKRQTA